MIVLCAVPDSCRLGIIRIRGINGPASKGVTQVPVYILSMAAAFRSSLFGADRTKAREPSSNRDGWHGM